MNMNIFLTSAVLAAVITSLANLAIGLKALKETRKFTSENRQFEYLKIQREELLKFLNELISFKPKTKTDDFIKAMNGETKALDRILQDGNMVDYPILKQIYVKHKIYFDNTIADELKIKIEDFDKKVDEFYLFATDRIGGENEKKEISKVTDIPFLINSSTKLMDILKETININLGVNSAKMKELREN